MTILKYDIAKIVTEYSTTVYADNKDSWSSPGVYVSRNGYGERVTWSFRISHSSSESSAYDVDSILKTELLRLQLADCIDTMKDMIARKEEFTAAFNAHREAMQAEHVARQAAAEAKRNADTLLTRAQIGHLVATMCVDIKHGEQYRITKRLRVRGSDTTVRLVARSTMGGAVQFKLGGELISKAKLATRLEGFAEILEALTTD